jgi:hypothetical protein
MLRVAQMFWIRQMTIIGTAVTVIVLTCELRAADEPQACLERVRRAETDPITCEITRRATAAERTSLATWTVGTLLDADCDVMIVIPKHVVERLRKATEPVDLPGQNVSCRIITNGGPLTAILGVGGRVAVTDGRASDFEPAIEIKGGLPPALGRLLLRFAAGATDVRQGVVAIINDIITPEPGHAK